MERESELDGNGQGKSSLMRPHCEGFKAVYKYAINSFALTFLSGACKLSSHLQIKEKIINQI